MWQPESDWVHALPLAWMALVVFAGTYLAAVMIYAMVRALATPRRARSFKAVSSGMLSPLSVLFGLFVAFTAAQVWTDNDRAENAIIREASAYRGLTLLAASFPGEPEARLRGLIRQQIQDEVALEWPMMAKRTASLIVTPRPLADALQTAIALIPATPGQQTAQKEIVAQLEAGLEARRDRILISRSQVSPLKWLCIGVQAVGVLLGIALIHCEDPLAGALAMGIFATGVATTLLLIMAFDRPFIGHLAVTPQLILQVAPDIPQASGTSG
jgi:Protein of unknown function (DUF4239)